MKECKLQRKIYVDINSMKRKNGSMPERSIFERRIDFNSPMPVPEQSVFTKKIDLKSKSDCDGKSLCKKRKRKK